MSLNIKQLLTLKKKQQYFISPKNRKMEIIIQLWGKISTVIDVPIENQNI